MKIVYSEQFIKSASKFPLKVQIKLDRLVGILKDNPYHALLHTKQLSGVLTGYLSFRITREWRVIFQFIDSQTIQLLRAAHRKDIYR